MTIEPTAEVADTHVELFSHSRKDGAYWYIRFADYGTINPNIIPHPREDDRYIIVAQEFVRAKHERFNYEVVCDATFDENNTLSCLRPPLMAPVAATYSPHCIGDYTYFNFNIGPHDARVFFGPETPYMVFGSQSNNNCFGQWIQDFRMLYDWGHWRKATDLFQTATDIQRPPPYHAFEKNYFVFWDASNVMYVHYEISPHRVFARLAADGSVGQDLGPQADLHDAPCLKKYLPPKLEKTSIHQATNSLSITLCRRSDPSCQVRPSNTFIMAVFHQKRADGSHPVYEPYVMLFRNVAPFELHGISRKPFWIHGRRTGFPLDHPYSGDSELMFITSMSWRAHNQKYHGYLDDMLFLSFGIEDAETGGIDVLAEDLLQQLGKCE
ncbi:hypothetical protein K470DRAFT_279789 [Piedraia hortae CBS 480.64]|uniref:Uncharacterized protein n=1 Tax=Piedraia hortae CBS 480.64 TaxID=1314780 RepID=A0A6A7C905_9PEZI|nr:hypothetical protein K470DRAFT_279789 [Piedraia hortae CBS 480.64]